MAPSNPSRLESLRLENFRGATRPVEFAFDTAKPMIMIFGESGTGKSVLVDALDFVCNESTAFLSDRKSTPVTEYLPALGSGPEAVRVELGWGGQSWTGRLQGAKPKIDGPAGRPRVRILRRLQLLQVVGAQPAKRYDELRDFIDVPGVERSEQALRQELQSIKEDLERTASNKAEAETHLRELWVKEGSPGTDPFTWARSQAAFDEASIGATKKVAAEAALALSRVERSTEDMNAAETAVTASEAAYARATEAVDAAEANSDAADAALVELLDVAASYLESHQEGVRCPVCEQGVDPAILRTRIAARRAAAAALANAVRAMRGLDQSLKAKTEALDAARGRAANDSRAAIVALNSGAPTLQGYIPGWQDFGDLAEPSAAPSGVLLGLLSRFAAACPGLRAAAEGLRDRALAQLSRLSAIRLHHETQEKLTSRLIELTQLENRLQSALGIVEESRKRYVDGVLAAISNRINVLYSAIHPTEKLGEINLKIEPHRRASLGLTGRFHDALDIPPEAYYSESHQDTLGLCVFLALAEYYGVDTDLLVADDILTSSDQAHLDRIISLLHDEIAGPQILITTHYRPWRDRYRFARGPAARVQLIELLPWSLAAGIRHTKTKLEVEELEAQLTREPIDRQAVASKAGVLLEATLDQLVARYECEIPYRPAGNHPLGDFFRGLGAKLRKLLVVAVSRGSNDEGGTRRTEIGPLITKVEEMTWVRDLQGAHFNLKGFDIGDAEIRALGLGVSDLVRALVCADCGELPRRSSGSSWLCLCGSTSLSPLTMPGRQPQRDEI